MSTKYILLSLLFCTAILTGCGGRQEATVSGTVTLDGQPLTKGNVAFYPAGSSGTAATGTISADGTYTVATGQQAGLPAGDYVIKVVAADPPPDDTTPPKLLTPEKYSRVETSPLKQTIVVGSNDVPLKLTTSAD